MNATPAARPDSPGPDRRNELLELVRAAPIGVTSAEVAAKTGLRPSTARTHLDHLVETGLLVKARASAGLPYRPAWRYRSAPADPAPTAYRLLIAAVLEHLAASGESGRAEAALVGQRWGASMAGAVADRTDVTQAVAAVLEALGFSPRPVPGRSAGGPVELHLMTCPYLELVRAHPDAMCGLHAGIVTGLVRAGGQPADAAVLEPFAAPDACVVRFRPPRRQAT
ncbi:MAG TPA: helix-turn-helix domain-containing protein [Actinoplanes sp.]|nr:helix-turn-helix domain-containing protein [Actinoplanes sp.]